jgi:hypothetical protein
LKENNFNFGVTIYLKSRADRQAAKRYQSLPREPIIMTIKNIAFLFCICFVAFSCKIMDTQKNDEYLSDSKGIQDTIIHYANLEIGADINGDGESEKLNLKVISKLTNDEIDSIVYTGDYQGYLKAFSQIKPQIVLYINDNEMSIISEDPKILRPWNLTNIGDVNNDGNDDISLVIEWYEYEKTDSCYIYSYVDNRWRIIGSAPIEISWTQIGDKDYAYIDDIIIQKNGKLYYKDQNATEVEIILRELK